MKDKETITIIQLSEGLFKAVQCLRCLNSRAEFSGFSLKELCPENDLSAEIVKLGFNADEIIAALPGNQATCRFLKIPGDNPEELEKISGLQASRYLPYPAEELATAYQIIRTDKEGFSEIILTIAHKSSITHYLNAPGSKPKKPAKLGIILSPYGVCNLFYEIEPKENSTVMLVELDNKRTELIVAEKGKMLFNHSINLETGVTGWEGALAEEINKTSDAFIKDARGERIERIILLSAKDIAQASILKIQQQAGIPLETLNYLERLNINPGPEIDPDCSFAGLIGLGLKSLPESLNILPKKIKENNLILARRNHRQKLAILAIGIIAAWFFGIISNLGNKTRLLHNLEKEINAISKEALPLEGIEKRFKLIGNNASRKDSPLDILYELHRLMPEQISLISLSYEEGKLVLLRGSATELDAVFNLASALGKSPAFSKFNIKIRFATRKKTQAGEVVDFEIGCSK
ncbi:MAG: PilN domain-containing protein [Candidatus Omnitrophota bacterium]